MATRRKFLRATSQILMSGSIANAQNWFPEPRTETAFFSDDSDEYWKAIRKEFSLTENRAYLNCGTLGPSPKIVLETTMEAMKEIDLTGEMGHNTTAIRQRIAQFVNVKPEEIALTHNTTEGINIMAWGLPLKQGDEIILTDHEHVGNAIPWLNRSKITGVKVKMLEIAETDEQILDNLKKLISPKTRAICVPHITCTAGRVLPIKEIIQWGRSKSIYVCIDGAHGAGMMNLNLRELDCDFYAACGHKWLLGPKGTGFLYVKQEIQDSIQPYFVGAGTHVGWDISAPKIDIQKPTPTAERYDYGTNNLALWKGMVAAINFIEKIGKDKVEARVRELNLYLHGQLMNFDKKELKILTPTEGVSTTSGMLGFQLLGKNTKAFAEASNKKYRIRFVPESNLNSIRISTHIFNNKIEIDGFVESLKLFLKV